MRYSVGSPDLASVEGIAVGIVEFHIEDIFTVVLVKSVKLGEIVLHQGELVALY